MKYLGIHRKAIAGTMADAVIDISLSLASPEKLTEQSPPNPTPPFSPRGLLFLVIFFLFVPMFLCGGCAALVTYWPADARRPPHIALPSLELARKLGDEERN